MVLSTDCLGLWSSVRWNIVRLGLTCSVALGCGNKKDEQRIKNTYWMPSWSTLDLYFCQLSYLCDNCLALECYYTPATSTLLDNCSVKSHDRLYFVRPAPAVTPQRAQFSFACLVFFSSLERHCKPRRGSWSSRCSLAAWFGPGRVGIAAFPCVWCCTPTSFLPHCVYRQC